MDGFSCKLKEWRLASGLSQQQIADLLNYGLSTVQSWEAGRKLPSYDALISLADIMGVSIDWLTGRTHCLLYTSSLRGFACGSSAA